MTTSRLRAPAPAPIPRRTFLAALSAAAALAACDQSSPSGEGPAPSPEKGPTAPLMPPKELADRLADVKAGKIAVFQVGPRQLWREGHVPGSTWVGEAGKPEGLAALEEAVRKLAPETEVVAYCGCCPIVHCPNLKPARRVLASRANARYLALPTTFIKDWADKGYPVERG